MFSLLNKLGPAAPFFTLVDIGAMELEGETDIFEPVRIRGRHRIVGFEPIAEECAKLNAKAPKEHTYLPYAVGDGTEREFKQCNFPMTSSLYEPNAEFIKYFQQLPDLKKVVKRTKMKTVRLDDIPEVPLIDAIKIDVQGAELDCLIGGRQKLSRATMIVAEVEWVPLYKDQPLFAEVDQELRRQGFLLHALTPNMGRCVKPILIDRDPTRFGSQVLWSNAIYIRDLRTWGQMDEELLLKTAVLLHECTKSLDMAALALWHHEGRFGGDLWRWYMTQLTGTKHETRPTEL